MNLRSLETFGEDFQSQSKQQSHPQNLTFSQNMDNSLLKIMTLESNQKTDVDQVPITLQKYREILDKIQKENNLNNQSFNSNQEGLLSNQDQFQQRNLFQKQNDLQDSNLSFDLELEKRLQDLEQKNQFGGSQQQSQNKQMNIQNKQFSESPKNPLIFSQQLDFQVRNKKESPYKIQQQSQQRGGGANKEYNIYNSNIFKQIQIEKKQEDFSLKKLEVEEEDDSSSQSQFDQKKKNLEESFAPLNRKLDFNQQSQREYWQNLQKNNQNQNFSTETFRYQESGGRGGEGIIEHEFLSNRESLLFVYKYFGQEKGGQQNIKIKYFLECLINEYSELFEEVSDEEIKNLQEKIIENFTTINQQYLSLNALELQTREIGLKNKIKNLLNEIKQISKQEKNDSINKKIVEELNIVKQMLDQKRVELNEKEKQLYQMEKAIVEKEKNLKSCLNKEFENISNQMENLFQSKLQTMNKKFILAERNLKNKVKIIESKQKETKVQQNVVQKENSQEEKLKAKIASVEKTNDFLKAKVLDLEKKLLESKDSTQILQNKNESQQKRILNLETKLKEKEIQLENERKIQQQLYDQFQQKDLEQVQLIQQNENNNNLNIGENLKFVDTSPIKNEDENNDVSDQTINEMKEMKDLFRFEVPVKKKKKIVTKENNESTTTKTVSQSEEELKVVLNMTFNILNCLKKTLPFMIQNKNQNKDNINNLDLVNLNQSGVISLTNLNQMMAAQNNNYQQQFNNEIDLGEIFYPNYSQLITNFIDLCPLILNKPHNQREVLNLIELFTKIIIFTFRFQFLNEKIETHLPENLLLNSQNLIKSNQDHVNEIMSNLKNSTEIVFNPLTLFWKKKIKIPKSQFKQISSLATNNQKPKPLNDYLSLFQNDELQKELVQIFSSYNQTSNLYLKKNADNFNNNNNNINNNNNNNSKFFIISSDAQPNNKGFENTKDILMTRININTLLIILSFTNKDITNSLKTILNDINHENEPLNQILKKYFAQNKGIQIIIWRLLQSKNEPTIVEIAIDILLNLSSMGIHYSIFLEELSTRSSTETLFTIFETFFKNHAFLEKLSVILQRLSYQSEQFRNNLTPKYVKLLLKKLADQNSNNQQNNSKSENQDEFLFQNIQAILSNIN